ncbi:diguanylate cyclase [Petroclostridium sp. X23]|uniref:diguanylate cyclase domain-containing protein n=1 Tax=Petroclostridium sp. X23 TaxID=3045146 RepID=UPI0024AE357B|nr:diguanylate cyclase [Petroclostridium sp. X23]WHH58617.1 diguanylate cyclase [Petroclostridium sp. X23]
MEKMENKMIKKIDLTSVVIITMFFFLIIAFSYMGLNENPMNVFLIFIVMLGTIIGYYTNFMTSMLYSITFIFLYASIHIFLNISKGVPVSADVYFWMVTVPIFSITFSYYGGLIRNIQERNSRLEKENNEFVMIDKDTGLLSSQTFFNELQVFMKINERYHIEVYLMLVKIKYENEVIGILGQSKYIKIVNQISTAISLMLREEDKKYILRDVNMFGIILLANKDGGEYVKNRLKETIKNINFNDDTKINRFWLEVQVGLVRYNVQETSSPYELFKKAEKDLEFDV